MNGDNMPIYTYKCEVCHTEEERMVYIDYRNSQTCKQCGLTLRRKVDRPGLVWSPTRNNGHS